MQQHFSQYAGLGFLILLSVAVLVVYEYRSQVRDEMSAEPIEQVAMGDLIRAGTAPIPEYTPVIEEKLQQSSGFQALVSYTDLGFEPVSLVVKAGDTVRFTNNSSKDLRINEKDTSEQCSEGVLDSCSTLRPMDFWEYTFADAGEWYIENALAKGATLTVRAE